MNFDSEGNAKMLTPSMCESCILKQRKNSTRRNIACCTFIAYNILVLSVVFVTLWYIFDSRERLERTERIVNALREKDDTVDGRAERHPAHTSSLAITVQGNKDRLKRSNTREISENIGRRIKRARNKNKRKRCKNCLPVVQIEGTSAFGNEDKTDLSNLWVTPSWLKTVKKSPFDVSSVSNTGKIKVVQGGFYILYAQMTLAGLSKRGYHIKKKQKTGNSNIASCVTFVNEKSSSEDEAKYMLRSCPTMTVVRLEEGDQVFAEEIDDNSRVLYSNTVFGLIRIGN